MRMQVRKIAYGGIFVALAAILSYVETLIPISLGVPGIKPGFANIVAVFALYTYGFGSAATINILRIILVSAMFGSPAAAIYSLSGALVSIIVMSLLKKTKKFSIIGVSMAGGVFHNAAQLCVAIAVTETPLLVTYLPVLIFAGVGTGVIIGIVSYLLIKRLPAAGERGPI